MRGRTPEFDDLIRGDHTAVCRVDLIRHGQVVQQVDVHTGSVTADRAASQLRTFEFEIADTDLVPAGQASLLSPFGTRVQLWRGLKHPATDTRVAHNDATTGWGVSSGTLSLKDASGVLRLGP